MATKQPAALLTSRTCSHRVVIFFKRKKVQVSANAFSMVSHPSVRPRVFLYSPLLLSPPWLPIYIHIIFTDRITCFLFSYIYIHICTHFFFSSLSIYVSMYLSMYLCIYLSMYLCIYLCMYLCMYVSMHVSFYMTRCLFLLCNVPTSWVRKGGREEGRGGAGRHGWTEAESEGERERERRRRERGRDTDTDTDTDPYTHRHTHTHTHTYTHTHTHTRHLY